MKNFQLNYDRQLTTLRCLDPIKALVLVQRTERTLKKVPVFLKPSFQRRMATAAAQLGDLNEWIAPRQAELLRTDDRRYFGAVESRVFQQRSIWVRRRGLN